MRDNLSIFEMRELELIESSLDSVHGDFGDDFRSSFIEGVMVDEEMRDFLFSDLCSKTFNPF